MNRDVTVKVEDAFFYIKTPIGRIKLPYNEKQFYSGQLYFCVTVKDLENNKRKHLGYTKPKGVEKYFFGKLGFDPVSLEDMVGHELHARKGPETEKGVIYIPEQ